MKERPILFSGAMVRAILDGRKTMTRRVVKPCQIFMDSGIPPLFDGVDFAGDVRGHHCPYGQAGDRLWVRETHALVRPWTDKDSGYVEDINEWAGKMPKAKPEGWTTWYAADSDDVSLQRDDRMVKRWRPSIFMPRWASRITLEVVAVRAERLREISEADAQAEGCGANVDYSACRTYGTEFRELWESINGAGSWVSNPYVWVVEFRSDDA